MLEKIIRWIMSFHYRRKAQQLLEEYDALQEKEDRTLWIGSFFLKQEEFLLSKALMDIHVNKLPSGTIYIYNDIYEVKRIFKEMLGQLQKNNAVNATTLMEFINNSHSESIHNVFNPETPIREQLIELHDILNDILVAYEKQTSTFKQMNLPRIIPLFEMYGIMVNRVVKGYLKTS